MPNTQKDWADIFSFVEDTVSREAVSVSESYCLSLANRFLTDLCHDVEFPMTWTNATGGELLIDGVEVALPTDCLDVKRVEWDDSDNPLLLMDSLERMDERYPGWRDESGVPAAYCVDGQTLYLSSAPGTSTGSLTVRGSGYLPQFSLGGDVAEDCEDAWTAGSNVTASTSAGKVGTYCASLSIDPTFTTGIIGYETTTAMLNRNMATYGYEYAVFWLKSSVAIADLSLVLEFALDDNATMGAGTLVGTALPSMAIPANTWKKITVPLSTAQKALTSVSSVGLRASADPGTLILYIDDVRLATAQGNPLDYLDVGAGGVIEDYILKEMPADPERAFEMARVVSATNRFERNYPRLVDSIKSKARRSLRY